METVSGAISATFPPLDLESWKDTRDALTAYASLLGRIRRTLTPPQNTGGIFLCGFRRRA
jgi:hypothetical protein